ncbi:hypothetical protein RND81_10G177700 [Saponaria officinalis]|uniref:Secreted protein n=1 Tax=Saponaria officinalis TaxID=3572 RepID=A0AAW1I5T5_SAPOF
MRPHNSSYRCNLIIKMFYYLLCTFLFPEMYSCPSSEHDGQLLASFIVQWNIETLHGQALGNIACNNTEFRKSSFVNPKLSPSRIKTKFVSFILILHPSCRKFLNHLLTTNSLSNRQSPSASSYSLLSSHLTPEFTVLHYDRREKPKRWKM